MTMIYIGKPATITEFYKTRVFIVYSVGIITTFWRSKESISTAEPFTYPHPIVLYQGKNLFVCNCIHIANNNELLFSFNYPCKEFPEKRKRRIRNNYISLIPQLFHFFASEIPVTIKIIPLQIIYIYYAVSCCIISKDKKFSMCLVLSLSNFGDCVSKSDN